MHPDATENMRHANIYLLIVPRKHECGAYQAKYATK